MRTLSTLAVALAVLVVAPGCSQVEQLAEDARDRIEIGQTDYETSQGETVTFPLGTVAFADRTERLALTREIDDRYTDVSEVLGPPDVGTDDCSGTCYVSLTSGGSLEVAFVNNTLYDGPGADLAVFEIGPQVEASTVEISTDGQDWVMLGRIEGSSTLVDIAGRGPEGAQYRFVRITDDPNQGGTGGSTPGADIDAVGAIHAEPR